MAVARSTPPDPPDQSLHGPVRTCIGCRRRAPATALLRIVVMPGATAGVPQSVARARVSPPEDASLTSTVVPDPRRRLPGRGAWLHPDTGCVELAQRRRAFSRALRVSGTSDPAAVLEYVAERCGATSSENIQHDTTSGSPQEMTSNGHSMKRQQ